MLGSIQVLRRGATAMFLSLILFSVSCDDDDQKAAQLINDTLEDGNAWKFFNAGDAGHIGLLEERASASLSHSLFSRSSLESSGYSQWVLTLQAPKVQPGSALELTVKVKVSELTGEGAIVAIRGDKKNSAYGFLETTQNKISINGTKDFESYTVKVDSYPDGIVIMYVFLILHGNSRGDVYFDDVFLVAHP